MCKKISVAILVMLSHAIAQADDVYYRWSRSGSTTISSDYRTIHLSAGSAVYLTIKGTGRLSFSGEGSLDGFYFINPNNGNATYITTVGGNYSIEFSGKQEHTIHWHTYATDHHGGGWGDITSITWNGTSIPYKALVELDANGGECSHSLCHVAFGAKAGTLPSATRSGFVFTGWYTKKAGGTVVNKDHIVSSDMVVYAHWKPTIQIVPESGTIFDSSLTVTISSGAEDALIYYTLDGSEPTTNSVQYKRFRISGKTTVKAVAIVDGLEPSDIAVAHYALGTCSDPIISLADGSVFQHSNQVVSIAWNETDGTLRYTLDGSEPTEESAEYTGVFQISETTTVKAKVFSDRYFDSDVVSATLTREWVQVATPVISTAATFTGEKSRVTISCAADGAKIRYTLDGSIPNEDSEVYDGAFYVTNSCTITAYAAMDDCTDSAVASVSVTKMWGAGDTMGVPSATFSDGGNTNWVRDAEVGMNGGESMRSGAIGNNQTSVLTATIKGKGTFSFWWKASCEDSGGYYDWDHAEFRVDGQTHYIDGETDWTKITYEFTTSGEHELQWIYYKDDAGKDGHDCVWIAAAQWEKDPIPEVGENPTVEDIEDALYGSRDARLMRRITTASGYAAYHSWADKVRGQDFTRRQVLKDSPNAWLAFMLDAPGLVNKAALASEDVVIESIEPSSTAGVFDIVIDIGGTEIGEDATALRLAEALGVEGATELNESAFTPEGLSVTFERTADGKVKAVVAPADTSPTFFMRIKIK